MLMRGRGDNLEFDLCDFLRILPRFYRSPGSLLDAHKAHGCKGADGIGPPIYDLPLDSHVPYHIR
jgi:hypothetical protein